MKLAKILFALVIVLCFSHHGCHAQVTSTFDTDVDGWTFVDAFGHNPSGYVSATYSSSATSTAQYWIAPAKFRGNHVVRSLDMNLRFALQQSHTGTASIGSGDVRIESSSLTLVYSLPVKPAQAPAWSSYTLALNESTGWRVNATTGPLASRTEIINALSNVTAIRIRASYITTASYTSSIDNVILEQKTLQAAPVITSFTPTTGVPGTNVIITGTNFNSSPSLNTVYFGSTSAQVLSASSSQLVVSLPEGAAFAPITVINKGTGLVARSNLQFTPTFQDGGRLIRASFDPRQDIVMANISGNEVTGLSLNDIDGDGWTDIIVAERSNQVTIYRNKGIAGDLTAASFDAGVNLAGAGNGFGLRVNDIDGDGKLDIASQYSDGFTTFFSTFRNTSTPGSISFEAVERWAGPVYSGPLSNLADIDGDGRVDLIGQHGNGSASPDFWIAQNISTPGQIEFGGSINYFGNTLDAGDGVSIGDLDNDGKPDLIVEHSFGSQFQIIENNSTPGIISFGTPFPIIEGVNGGVQVVDLNDDGKLDLAWKKGFSNDDVTVRLNTNSDATLEAADFATEIIFDSDLGNYGGVGFSDLNGDGKVDIMASDPSNMGVYEKVFSGGVFDSKAFVSAYLHLGVAGSTYPTTPLAADLNGDSRPDIVMGTTNTNPPLICLYENRNTIAPQISINTVSPLKGIAGNTVTITGSNFSTNPSENLVRFGSLSATVQSATSTELVVSVPNGVTTGMVSVTRDELTSTYHLPFVSVFSTGVNFATSHFSTPVSFTLTNANYDVEAADLNGDNKTDVVAEGQTVRAYVFKNVHISGGIHSGSLVPDDTTSASALDVKPVDLDEDGLMELVGAASIFRNSSTSGEVQFNPATIFSPGNNVGFGDFNKDGKTDIVGVNGSVLRVTETRTTPQAFTTTTPVQTFENFDLTKPAGNGGAAAGDFDNDGWIDIAATNPTLDNVSLWRNTGSYRISTTQFTATTPVGVGDNPGRLYTSDVDVDGKIDIVLYYSTTTTSQFVTILHNQSTVGNFSFSRIDLPLGAVGTTVAVNDLDGDGKPEILVTSEAANRFSIFKNNTTPGNITASSFASPFHTSVTTPRGITTGDLNFDGKPEIILTRAPNLLLVYENLIPNAVMTLSSPSDLNACTGSNATLSLTATGTTNITYQWQKLNTATLNFENLVNGSQFAGVTTSSLTILDATTGDDTDYRAIVNGDFVSADTSSTAHLFLLPQPTAPSVTGASACPGASATISASGAGAGQYRWYLQAFGGTPVSGEVNASYTTPPLSAEATYYISAHNGTCESTRTPLTITMLTAPAKPVVTASGMLTFCEGNSVTLTAPAGFTYNWSNSLNTAGISVNQTGSYSVKVAAANGCESESSDAISVTVFGKPTKPVISYNRSNAFCQGGSITLSAPAGFTYQWSGGEQSQSITVNASGNYAVTLTDANDCSSEPSDEVTVTVHNNPSVPVITSPNGNQICQNPLTLQAPAGYSYNWSTGATSQTISVNTAGDYTVEVIDGNGCSSLSNVFTVIPGSCNQPPVIGQTEAETQVGGSVSINLLSLLSDPDNNVDAESLSIVENLISGANARIDNGNLILDYSGLKFAGEDRLVIQVCDTQGQCVVQTIFINVVGNIIVYNGLSPNNDGKNDFWMIEYVDVLENTKVNEVKIFNRWGDVVWEGTNYDNNLVVFRGTGKNGQDLPTGTYFYQISFNARKEESGYLSLRR
jgi:gliding motility-associated-like protein